MREYAAADLALAQGGFGKAQFAATTQHLLDHLREVDLVVCAGVAGALTESVRLGDVVIGTATLEHDFHSVILGGAPPRFEGSATHLAELGRVADLAEGFRVHFAPIASGDEGIVDARRRAEVHARTEALAVAYEGAGGARAAAFSQVPYLEVRGISDMANDDFLEHFEANLPRAMDERRIDRRAAGRRLMPPVDRQFAEPRPGRISGHRRKRRLGRRRTP